MAGIDQYTKLLLHCDGDDESISFIDSSQSAHVVTAQGDAQIDTTISKFGNSSGEVLAKIDYLTIPYSSDFNFSDEDFTIDCWFYIFENVSTTSMIFSQDTWTDGTAVHFGLGSSNDIRIKINGSQQDSGTNKYLSNEWNHIAFVRQGSLLKIYINGSLVHTFTVPETFPTFSTESLQIAGLDTLRGFTGWIDEFRISKGIARWTENFTPPTEEYTDDNVNIDETITLNDDWEIQTNPELQNIDEAITLNDEWLIQSNPEQGQIEEAITLNDEWNISTIEYSNFASKIISYNPLIYVTNSNPAKIIKVDITDPENPIKYTYEIVSNSYAKDIVFNSSNDYFYIICVNGKIVKINKDDLEDQTIIDTLDTDILLNVDAIDSYFLTFVSTDYESGEIIMLDEREVKKINIDIRWSQQIIKIISTQINWILGKLVNLDLRWKAITSKTINLDLRWLKSSYDDIFKFPISYSDWEVYINGTELTVLDDVDMNSILITHDITQEEIKASQVQFILNRRHDKLNYTNTGVSSEITNNNIVIVKIKGVTEFTGKISNLSCNSETETVNVIAIGSRPSDKRHTVNIPMSGLNEQLHLYHCLINNINIDNPYINPNDENPEYYKGIQVDLGIKIEQNILRYSAVLDTVTLAEKIENGEFTPKQNWTYFWFAKFSNFITGRIQSTLSYLGTSLGSLSADTWKLNNCSYKYQKELDDTETELGIYQVGEAPYDEISAKNGKKITKDKWVDKNNGLYIVKDEGYDYTEYIKQIANLEYQKLLNINGQILPKTSAEINLSVDAYYYYNIGLLTRINVTNTTTSNIYNIQNGFPVSVKNIRIQCATEGENSMIVTLTCDNAKSQLELEEIDAQYPDDTSDEFLYEEKSIKQNSKFDPNTWSYLV